MKQLLFLLILLSGFMTQAQRYKSSESNIKFYSSAPLEDIEAYNEKSTSIIDTEKNAVVFVVPITGFQFKKSLMQEHFNENYMESEKYPKGIFKGRFEDWDGSSSKENVKAVGEMEIHGVKQEVTIDGSIEKTENGFKLSSVFPIRLEDYDIDIPKAVFYKIAEEVEVTVNFDYTPYEEN